MESRIEGMGCDDPHISVCVCTFKRPMLLKELFKYLLKLETNGLFTYSVVVVDNDVEESARDTVRGFADDSSVPIIYDVEPDQNIAKARNRCARIACGDYVAFIDDDEYPDAHWLLELFNLLRTTGAAGVLGPVSPVLAARAPRWILDCGIHSRPRYPTGQVLKWHQTRTSNVLLNAAVLGETETPFRVAFRNGAEDVDFFKRMIASGKVFVWCDDAEVHEEIPMERCSLTYLYKKAWLMGQSQRCMIDGRSVLESVVAIPLYSFLLPLLFVTRRRMFLDCSRKVLFHMGKLCALVGIRPMGEKYI